MVNGSLGCAVTRCGAPDGSSRRANASSAPIVLLLQHSMSAATVTAPNGCAVSCAAHCGSTLRDRVSGCRRGGPCVFTFGCSTATVHVARRRLGESSLGDAWSTEVAQRRGAPATRSTMVCAPATAHEIMLAFGVTRAGRYGLMFRLTRKRLAGSYSALTVSSLWMLSRYDSAVRSSPSSAVWKLT